MTQKLLSEIIKLIIKHKNVLIMPSSPVDGDSIGSSLAMALALRKLDKQVSVICSEHIPELYSFLPAINQIQPDLSPTSFIITIDCSTAEIDSIETIKQENKLNLIITPKSGNLSSNNLSFSTQGNNFDLIITVDTASTVQLGKFYETNQNLFKKIPVINIDHHATNENFGTHNWVDIKASSTTELILSLLEELQTELNQNLIDTDIATLLLTGVVTDTGSFQNSNTTPRSFASSAKLIRYGGRQQEIIKNIFKTKPLSTLKLWGRILQKLQVNTELRFAYSIVTQNDLLETGSREDETGGIIDELLSNAPNIDLVLLLKEKDGKILSGSLRSVDESVNVSEIAEQFGGGGHKKASGFKIKNADFNSHGQIIIDSIINYQKNRLNSHPYSGTPLPDNHLDIAEALRKLEQLAKSLDLPPTSPSIQKPHIDTPQISPSISNLSQTTTQTLKSNTRYKFEA